MHVFHYSPYRDSNGKIQSGAAKAALGSDWKDILKAEDSAVATIDTELDERFTLLRNVDLPLVGPIGMIIVGPTGVHTIANYHAAGMFKAEGHAWLEYDRTQMQFARSADNPIETARAAASYLRELLHTRGLPVPSVEATVLLTNPRTQLTLEGPAVNTVTPKDVGRFATSTILGREVIMDAEDVQAAVDIIREHAVAPEAPADESTSESDSPPSGLVLFGMNRRQLTLLAVMALLDLCVLGGFALVVLRDTLRR